MNEEKHDDQQEQQDFLSSHEQLLNAIHKKSPEEPAEAAPETDEETPAPAAEESVTEEAPVAEEPAPVQAPAPAPIAEEKPEPAPQQPKPAPKKKKHSPKKKHTRSQSGKTTRTEEERKRHEELLKQKSLEDSEVKEVLKFFRRYLKPAATVTAVVCLLVLFSNYIKSSRLKKEAAADTLLLKATSAADYQAILDDYGKTPSAPLALMGLAQEKFNAAQPQEAEALYDEFLRKYPEHEMAVQARFNQISCKEAQGRLEEAAQLFENFHKDNSGSHLAPMALLGQARCLEALSRFAEAKQVYEDILAFYPDTGYAHIAETKLAVVEAKLK